MSELKLVVFDVDGTLIDSQDEIKQAMRQAFTEIDRAAPTDRAILSIVGMSLAEALRHLDPAASEAEIQHGAEAYRRSVFAIRDGRGKDGAAPMFPGARDALERLHARDEVLLGVATGNVRRGLDHIYEDHDIGHFFVTHQTADFHPSKPHPAMLLQALHESGCDARNGAMIGDTEFDMAMGRAAGMVTVGVSWGYHDRDRLHRGGADVIIDRFTDLDAALQELWDKRR